MCMPSSACDLSSSRASCSTPARRMTAWMWVLAAVVFTSVVLCPGAQGGASEGVVTKVEVYASVEHRFAVTRVATMMLNPRPEPSQLLLHMTLPKSALVSSFAMEMGGGNFSGSLTDKRSARRTYQAARQQGRTTGLLELRDNDLQKLQVRASVPGLARVTFHVTYEELLERIDGSIRYTVHLNPGHRVPEANVRVRVLEREAIADYRVEELPGQEMRTRNPGTSVTGGPVSEGELHVLYQHQDPVGGEGKGVDGTFTLSYEITNHTDGGEVQRVGSYFAHFFSPERLPKMATHTVFLLDVSLSMYNGKLDSMKDAMKSILRGMDAQDTFEILAFSSDVVSMGSFSGEERQVKRAVRKVKRLVSLGYSNLNAALLQAIKRANSHGDQGAVTQVVVLSDGQATSGETDAATLRSSVRKANAKGHPIFIFIFGEKSELLGDISADSGGFAQHLHHGSSTAEQIKSFYKEIARPLMADVNITYPESDVEPENLVRSGMSNYYSGGEIVVAGRLRPGITQAHPSVSARGREGPHQLPATRLDSRDPFFASVRDNYIARIWAYLMLQDLLAQAAAPQNINITQQLQEKALEIALRFNFVSPLTSLVVVYPQDNHLLVSVPEGPHRLGGAARPNHASGSPGSRRRGRSNMRGSRPQTYVDLDPHFLVHVPGLDLPLCFNYEDRAGVNVRLLQDPQSGIIINGHVEASVLRPNNKYFTRLFLHLGQVNLTVTPELLQVDCLGDDGTPQVGTVVKSLWPFYKKNGRKYSNLADSKIQAARRAARQGRRNAHRRNQVTDRLTPNHLRSPAQPNPSHLPLNPRNRHTYFSYANVNESVERVPRGPLVAPVRLIDDLVQDCRVNASWEKGVGRIYGNVMVVLSKKKSLDITIGDGLAQFTIMRSKSKRGQRFLGFYIKDQEIFSPQTHGMMGQFISKRVRRVYPTVTSDNVGADRVTLEVARRNHGKKPNLSQVSGVVGSRFSLMGRTKVRCIQIRNRNRGLLDGKPRDYLLPCLQC